MWVFVYVQLLKYDLIKLSYDVYDNAVPELFAKLPVRCAIFVT